MDQKLERPAFAVKPMELCRKVGVQARKAVFKNPGIFMAGRAHCACDKRRGGKRSDAAIV